MYFSSLPEAYAPIGAPLRYALAEASAAETLVRIRTADNRLLGTKRFVGRRDIAFDIAPYLRSDLRFTPQTGPSGVEAAADRARTIVVEAESYDEGCRSAARTFLAADRARAAPSLLTALPPARLLAPDETDELTLLAAAPMRITVTAERRDTLLTESYAVPAAGLFRFRLSAADFPEAERLTVDLGPCGSVVYTVMPAPDGAQRIAWRSRCGSIEHYTFPVVQRVERSVSKQRARSGEGLLVAAAEAEECVELHSAYETAGMAAALAELVEARQVWWLDTGGYRPIDVVTERAELHRCGTMRSLALTVRSTRPSEPLWNC